jgi:hypothetical protein
MKIFFSYFFYLLLFVSRMKLIFKLKFLMHLLINHQLQFTLARLHQHYTMISFFHFSGYVSSVILYVYMEWLICAYIGRNFICALLDKLMLIYVQLCRPVKSWKSAQEPSNGRPKGYSCPILCYLLNNSLYWTVVIRMWLCMYVVSYY